MNQSKQIRNNRSSDYEQQESMGNNGIVFSSLLVGETMEPIGIIGNYELIRAGKNACRRR